MVVAGKAVYKTAKAVHKYRARKRAERRGAPLQRIRPLGESEGTREDFKREHVREEYSRLIDCCYTDRSRLSKWRQMQRNCPVTEEQEANAGIQHNLLLEGMDPNNHFHKLVIAIRGTTIDLDDLKADIRHTLELVHRSNRFKKCLELIEKLKKHYIEVYGGNAKDIVVTGHSLGASIAFLISLSLSDISPPHLFNQPCMSMVSLLDNVLPGKRLRDRMRQLSVMRASDKIKQASDIALAAGRGELFQLAAQLIRLDQETFSRALNLKAEYFMSLVPSVNMFISDMAKGNPFGSHGIKQWFSSRLSNGQHPDNGRKTSSELVGLGRVSILDLGEEDFDEEDFEDSDSEDLEDSDSDSDEDDDWEEGEDDYGDECGVEYGYYEDEYDLQDSDSDEYEDWGRVSRGGGRDGAVSRCFGRQSVFCARAVQAQMFPAVDLPVALSYRVEGHQTLYFSGYPTRAHLIVYCSQSTRYISENTPNVSVAALSC
uniref:Predicted protein n=1 Tax=Physcomitrium patens TaxID=3218 RepID=A9U1B8_PHYPA